MSRMNPRRRREIVEWIRSNPAHLALAQLADQQVVCVKSPEWKALFVAMQAGGIYSWKTQLLNAIAAMADCVRNAMKEEL